jgi:hypothetical protein
MAQSSKQESSDGVDNSNLSFLGHFFTDSIKLNNEWSMKCKFCSARIKSRTAVTSNFHQHIWVYTTTVLLFYYWLSPHFGPSPVWSLPILVPDTDVG